MKRSELRQIIKEEYKAILSEGIFRIDQLDQEGRHSEGTLILVKAKDEQDARDRAAKLLKNPGISTMGFWNATQISQSDVNKKIKELEAKLKIWKSIK